LAAFSDRVDQGENERKGSCPRNATCPIGNPLRRITLPRAARTKPARPRPAHSCRKCIGLRSESCRRPASVSAGCTFLTRLPPSHRRSPLLIASAPSLGDTQVSSTTRVTSECGFLRVVRADVTTSARVFEMAYCVHRRARRRVCRAVRLSNTRAALAPTTVGPGGPTRVRAGLVFAGSVGDCPRYRLGDKGLAITPSLSRRPAPRLPIGRGGRRENLRANPGRWFTGGHASRPTCLPAGRSPNRASRAADCRRRNHHGCLNQPRSMPSSMSAYAFSARCIPLRVESTTCQRTNWRAAVRSRHSGIHSLSARRRGKN